MVRRRVVVSGRVQGVWFRESCRREADAHGVRGFVANRADGRVEAAFEGEPGAVQALVSWCRRGPSRAEVISVEVHDEEPQGERGFRVR
jgi:acylphosphatase